MLRCRFSKILTTLNTSEFDLSRYRIWVWKLQDTKTPKCIIPHYTSTLLTICSRAGSYEGLRQSPRGSSSDKELQFTLSRCDPSRTLFRNTSQAVKISKLPCTLDLQWVRQQFTKQHSPVGDLHRKRLNGGTYTWRKIHTRVKYTL